jgi:four helix bundle protein
MELTDLEVYRLAKEIAQDAWSIYDRMDYHSKKILGDQFIEAADSVAANIAEGFGRSHYADKNKFNYNARGSLQEFKHWLDTLHQRNFISQEILESMSKKIVLLSIKLNNFIRKGRAHS